MSSADKCVTSNNMFLHVYVRIAQTSVNKNQTSFQTDFQCNIDMLAQQRRLSTHFAGHHVRYLVHNNNRNSTKHEYL